MVIYTDLLTQALGNDEVGRRSNDLLLADLVHSRARLCSASGTTPVAEALARELSYDGALIRLCTALEVPATPARFANPEHERSRLEQELGERGVALLSPAAGDPQPS